MKEMSKDERRFLKQTIEEILAQAVTKDYAKYILENTDDGEENCEYEITLMEHIVDNVLETSAWENEGNWNDDDVRLAIGRELMDRLGIDV